MGTNLKIREREFPSREELLSSTYWPVHWPVVGCAGSTGWGP